MNGSTSSALPPWSRVLVVVAHPDDESFGLGAVIDAFVRAGARVEVLCLTSGEASTLGADAADLAAVRADELAAAGAALGVGVTLLERCPDGQLGVDPGRLDRMVHGHVARQAPDGILVFDPDGGVTGHPDHREASLAALRAAEAAGLPVLGWLLPQAVAEALNREFGAAFAGHPPASCVIDLPVDRSTQLAAVHAHASQAVPGSVLWRRLELLGDHEYLRPLR